MKNPFSTTDGSFLNQIKLQTRKEPAMKKLMTVAAAGILLTGIGTARLNAAEASPAEPHQPFQKTELMEKNRRRIKNLPRQIQRRISKKI